MQAKGTCPLPMPIQSSSPSCIEQVDLPPPPIPSAKPSLLQKNFAYSVQKHIPSRSNPSLQKFKQPAPRQKQREQMSQVESRNRRQSEVKNTGRSVTDFASSNQPNSNPFYRGDSRQNSHVIPTTRAMGTDVGINNPKFPILQTNTRRSIPTRPETLSPFRRLYSSSSGRARGNPLSSRMSMENGNGTDFSWSISKR